MNEKKDNMKQSMSGAEILVSALKRHSVEVIFGQSIPSTLFLAAPRYGIRQIGYRTENAGAAMADAYSRVSHKVAIVTAQNGPGATLLVPSLAEAFKASIPIVAIVQDVTRQSADKNAFQELDHIELFKGVSKWVRRVSFIDRIDDYVDMAFTAATTSRPGPAVLIVPFDLFEERSTLEHGKRNTSLGIYPLDRCVPDPERIEIASNMLASANSPIVIAGGGVHTSGATDALIKLQESVSLPVATTVMGKGSVVETHPLSLGVVGYFMGTRGRTKHLRSLITDADVVLLVGNRTNQNGTDSWELYPKKARYIHIDIDGQEVGRNYESEVRLVGDAKLTLEALNDTCAKLDLSKRKATRSILEKQIIEGHKAFQVDLERLVDFDKSPIRPERIMRDLDSILTSNTLVVADASYSSIWATNFLIIRNDGQRIITPRGLAGLGWGLPYALGAKTAFPNSVVIALVGDGGFAHVWSELETSRRMQLPVVVVVLNNQILGYQKHAEKVLFNNYTDACDFQPVDHAAIGRACGVKGVTIESPDDFLPAIKSALSASTSTVIDVITDQRAYPPITMFENNAQLNYY